MHKCLICKQFVLDADWEEHVKRLHFKSRKVPFKFFKDNEVPREILKLLDPPLPPIPVGATGRIAPSFKIPLDAPEPDAAEFEERDYPAFPIPVDVQWWKRNCQRILMWIFVIALLISLIIVIASKTKWSLHFLGELLQTVW